MVGSRAMDNLPLLDDDGLLTPEVGSWAEDKYQLVKCYSTIFSNAMSSKWGSLAYIDLFAGAGRSRVRDSIPTKPAPPHVALDIPKPFSKYIFAKLDALKISALESRIGKSYPSIDVAF